MKKKVISAILCGAMVLGTVCPVLAADDKSEDTKTEAAGNSAEGKKIALVGKAAGNAFFEIAAKSFQETVEAEGGEVQVVYPETATADAQIKVLDNLISQDFDAICISANDVNALQAKLEEAMDEGIKVSSFDSAPNKDSREIFVNQAGTKEVAQALMDAVLDISGGEGQFAILSATSQSANQNAWIDAMKTIMEGDDKYSKLELVDVVYGDDDSHSCPYFYLWDMQGLGKLSAYTTISLINGDITGAKDDKFTAGDLGDYTVTDADDGGTEVVLGAPLKFDTSNIEEMAKLY